MDRTPLDVHALTMRCDLPLPIRLPVAGVLLVPFVLTSCASMGTQFDDGVRAQSAAQPLPPVQLVSDADLEPVPPVVARWLRRIGVVGRPHVHNFVVEMDAKLNRGPGQPWMETPVLQVSFIERPARFFLLRTTMKGLPVRGLHAYADGAARMQIRVLGLLDVVDDSGPAMTRAETVTVLNDLCIFAPAALLDRRVTWGAATDTTAIVTFENGPFRVSATLIFDAAGDLVDFVSDDRQVRPDDGYRWTTPLRGHRPFDALRLPSEGDAVWHYRDKPSWTYGRFDIRRVRYNVPAAELPTAEDLAARPRSR